MYIKKVAKNSYLNECLNVSAHYVHIRVHDHYFRAKHRTPQNKKH